YLLFLHVLDLNRAAFLKNGELHRLRQNIGIAVGNPLESVLILVQFDDEDRWIRLLQDAGSFNGFTPSAVGFQTNPLPDVTVEGTLDLRKRVFAHGCSTTSLETIITRGGGFGKRTQYYSNETKTMSTGFANKSGNFVGSFGKTVRHRAGRVRRGLDFGCVTHGGHPSHHLLNPLSGLSPTPHVEMNLHRQVGRQSDKPHLLQPFHAGKGKLRLPVDPVAQIKERFGPVAGIVEQGPFSDAVDDNGRHKHRFPVRRLGVRPQDDLVPGISVLFDVGANVGHDLLQTHGSLTGMDKKGGSLHGRYHLASPGLNGNITASQSSGPAHRPGARIPPGSAFLPGGPDRCRYPSAGFPAPLSAFPRKRLRTGRSPRSSASGQRPPAPPGRRG